jgi:ubiquinone/menaquinone biosynthesis C-methylase UbiE
VCFSLYDASKDADYLLCGTLALYYVQSKQIQANGMLRGSLPASVPIWGKYHPMAFVNWGPKFFADALLQFRKYNIPVWKQQEQFVRQCFRLKADSGRWADHSTTLDALDEQIMESIVSIIEQHCTSQSKESLHVLDIGCGEGRCMKWLHASLPAAKCFGVDPVAGGDDDGIRVGSAYEIEFPNDSFDVVYSYVSLQHVANLDRVFSEVRRVLKRDGIFVVSDRHRFSGRGLLKPWHEFKGRWMYAWDSPFLERWYTPAEWLEILDREGFDALCHKSVNSPTDRGIRKVVPANRFLIVAGRKRTTN